MQGFNKYYPPDFDPEKHGSLNSYQGKHALGDRARKIDQGILIVRFELPFNIWCGGCNNHIGMGVRYNAEKKKIGNYYTTPIYSFRCKCHLCDNWFTIETDPKNTRYVVTSGARQKDEEWDPEEHGGFAIHDPDAKDTPTDPLAALEKSTQAEHTAKTIHKPRLEALQAASDHYNSDPFTHSARARAFFRSDKKVEKRKRDADEAMKGKYGLPEELKLVEEDEETKRDAERLFKDARAEREDEAKRAKLTGDVKSSRSSLLLPSGPSTLFGKSLPSKFSSSSKRPSPNSTNASTILRKQLLGSSLSTTPRDRPKLPDPKKLGVSISKRN